MSLPAPLCWTPLEPWRVTRLNTYSGYQQKSCMQIEQGHLRLARANGEVLYSIPLGRVAGLAHPAPNILKVKVRTPLPRMSSDGVWRSLLRLLSGLGGLTAKQPSPPERGGSVVQILYKLYDT
jgi:hypothetical protein